MCYDLANITFFPHRLRAPKAPGANAAMGHHKFTYALMPHTGWYILNFLIIINHFPKTINTINAFVKATSRML